MRLPIRIAGEDLDRVLAVLDTIAARLDKLIALNERALANSAVPDGTNVTKPDQRRPSPKGPKAPRGIRGRRSARRNTIHGETLGRRLGLHQAIEMVLRDADGPLSAQEIAERLNARQLFVGRVIGKPVSASQVNSRVSHPHYKGQFLRRDRRIALANEQPS